MPDPGAHLDAVNTLIARTVVEAVAPIKLQSAVLLDRVASLEREHGRLEERADHLVRERDQLQLEVARLRLVCERELVAVRDAPQAAVSVRPDMAQVADGASEPLQRESEPSTKRRGWFARLFRERDE